jgi:hypothetical protein
MVHFDKSVSLCCCADWQVSLRISRQELFDT